MSSSKKQVLSGVWWNGVQMLINQSFSFVLRLVLAKLLFPAQFGVVGMAMIFTGFVQVLTEMGIGAALIQRKDEDLTFEHYNTAFWTGVVWSIALFILMVFAVAPLAADFYKEPILKSLIPVISIGILVSPINLVNKAQLTKKMDFKAIAKIDNFSTILSGIISLIFAYFGFGVWALAINATASIVIAIPFYFKATKWYPRLSWNKTAFNDIFSFGMFTIVTNIVNYTTNNIDYLFIGKLLNAELLGAYTLAFILTDTFKNRIMAVMNNVMYPFYGKAQNDLSLVKKYYLKVISYNSIIVYPIMVFFIVYAKELILAFWGNKWFDAIDPLKILAGSVIFHMMVNSNTVLIRGLGYPRLEMKLQILKAVLFVPTLIYFISKWGINGASWAVLLNKVFAVILAQYTFNRLINVKVSTMEFLEALKVPMIASMAALVVGYALQYFSVNFIVGGVIMMMLYILVVWAFMKTEVSVLLGDLKLNRKQ
jgi:O-antigen/teichoic acid export membrane protein